ncbi:endonuclease III domain-containing protein [Desulfurobacterium atlanticum]|uniref:DNA-3-methyladenine glycosylase III n=1 Tax=Desulfurobacterium atlanticum TaxID=240169 RepID=A0A238ZIK6_9BACT|nr:endonuclease III domain-containing protein [Desulfurobacterium atlanticum]SNR82534.1 DNA-3-methyladenine glycosylase III [Desulfurobacterium atlanticum]
MFLNVYEVLFKFFGPQNWWPADDRFEVCVGAILTQNTSWSNVEKAIRNLKVHGYLSPERILELDSDILKSLIRPAGFYNQKAERLKIFSRFLLESGGFESLSKLSNYSLRETLLSLKGIGKETADSILLYAFSKPIFVVDAYTKRLFYRLGLIDSEKIDYDKLRKIIEGNIPADITIYNEFHALIVRECKEFCRKKPVCENCPIVRMCRFYERKG